MAKKIRTIIKDEFDEVWYPGEFYIVQVGKHTAYTSSKALARRLCPGVRIKDETRPRPIPSAIKSSALMAAHIEAHRLALTSEACASTIVPRPPEPNPGEPKP